MKWLGRAVSIVIIPVLTRTPFWLSRRVRVVVMNNTGQVLLIKSWISTQCWSLPGGGVERGEEDVEAAAREVHEETGYKLPLGSFRYVTSLYSQRLKADLPIYTVMAEASDLPRLHRPYRLEIMERQWFDRDNLPPDVSALYRQAIKLAFSIKN